MPQLHQCLEHQCLDLGFLCMTYTGVPQLKSIGQCMALIGGNQSHPHFHFNISDHASVFPDMCKP